MDKLPKCGANYVPLTPITFLQRAAMVYSNRPSVIYRGVRFTWRQTYERCCRLASALRSLNVVKNDVVSVLAPNVPAIYEMHFAVPMAGAVLNTINTRLDAQNIATILKHSEAKVFFVDYQYVPLARDALRVLMANSQNSGRPEKLMPLVVVIDDVDQPTGTRLGALEYEQLVSQGNPGYVPAEITNEWDPISLNYTSGTTSEPKGVVYSHRGAYLSTLSLILGWEMKSEPIYLWSLPMFHCNGWTFTWGVAARGGTNVCIRNTTAVEIYDSIVSHNATGPALVCEWQKRWNKLPAEDQARLKARQGISILTLADADVKDPETMESVSRDGKTMGEIVLRGSSIMKGYLKDEKATAKAFRNGWFFTGDVGVVHPDGYLEIKDSSGGGGGGYAASQVGESPCAFVTLRNAAAVEEAEIIQHCRRNLPHYMVPKKVAFIEELPKTSTGKIQKFQLRAIAKTFEISSENESCSGNKSSSTTPQSSWEMPRHYQYQNQEQILALSRL
ncbi:UNVERIFIED_CONTAM: Butyrate--CoA ligase AAE11, peroxisomal [Sesamum calycinum]|uniref:Butyrate--CoA ligase AAE11, peroxisomal n=1 Tax=Sesamum calycinum TaxID=2727403 RepID=A0AAW2KFU6_9LAMI